MRRTLVSLFALAAATLLGAGWYAYDRGFTRKWRNYVAGEFRQRGIELWLSRLTLDPFRGIIAKNVQVYDARDRRHTMAVIDEMRLVINWANLVQGKPFLDALDLTDASLSLPIDPENPRGPKVDINGLSGRLFLPPQQIYLSRLEADLYGLHVKASGRVINPQKFQRPHPDDPTQPPALARFAASLIAELRALKYSGPPPEIEVRFSGDLAQPDQLFAELTLWAEHVAYKGINLETLYVAADYRDGRVEVKQLSAHDRTGELRLSGDYDVTAQSAALVVHSTLDPTPVARVFAPSTAFQDLAFRSAPTLDLTVRATFGGTPDFQLLGHVGAAAFAYKAVDFEGLAADFSWDGQRWSARDVRIVHHTGEITGDILQVPGDVRTRIESTINPKIIRPLLTGAAAEWFSQFDFADPARIEAEARGARFDAGALTGHAALQLGRASYRGVAAQSASARFSYADRKLVIDPFQVARVEGAGSGALTFDFARDELRVDKVRASLHPTEAMVWVNPNFVQDVAPYRFGKRPPNVTIDGLVHTKGGGSTKLSVDVDAPGGMDYTFLKHDLHTPQIAAKLAFTSTGMKIDDLSASLFGGRLHGDAEISLVRETPGHTVGIRLDNVDFQSLTKLYFGYDNAKGRLNGSYRFTGKVADSRAMQGTGNLAVTEGDIFAIPFLGPLSGVLNSIVTGMGSDVARKATATFTIGNGVIKTDDLVVEASSFSMFGNGDLDFADDQMDFNVRINARGLPGVLLFPVSKLFEYVADDKLSKPKWRPKALPRL